MRAARTWRNVVVLAAAGLVLAPVAGVPAGAEAPAPIDPATRWQRQPDALVERVTAVDPGGLAAWFDPGAGALLDRPETTWTRAGVTDLLGEATWTLDVPAVPDADVADPLPLAVDAAGATLGIVSVTPDGGSLERRAARWDDEGGATLLDLPADVTAPWGRPVAHVDGELGLLNAWVVDEPPAVPAPRPVVVRWDGEVPSLLAGPEGTDDCRVDVVEGFVATGRCWWTTPPGATVVRWDLAGGGPGTAVAPGLGDVHQVLGLASAGDLVVTAGADHDVVRIADDGTSAVVPDLAPWPGDPAGLEGYGVQGGLVLDDGALVLGRGWGYDADDLSRCFCRAAVVEPTASGRALSWLDLDGAADENAAELVGQLDDGSLVLATSTFVGYGIAPFTDQVIHRGTARYVRTPRTTFTDVPPGNVFFDDIARARELGYVKGAGDGSFDPTAVTTRQALVAMVVGVWTAYGAPAPPACDEAPFPDVAVDDPFCAVIAQAKALGWVGGFADGTFRPRAPVSRQQVAAVLLAADPAGRTPTCATTFTDVGVGSPFCPAISWASAQGFVSGRTTTTFDPSGLATRGAATSMVQRAGYQFELLNGGLRGFAA